MREISLNFMNKKIRTLLCLLLFVGTITNDSAGNVYVAKNAKLSLTTTPVIINGDLTIEQGMEQGAELDLGNSFLTVSGNIKVDWMIEADRWYSIGFPFDVETVFSKDFEEKGWDPYELTATTTGTDGDYYLKEYKPQNGKSFQYVLPKEGDPILIKAGKGYIFQFPSWLNETEISFIGSGKTLTKVNTLSTMVNQLVPNTNLNTSTFNLVVSENSHYKYDDIDTYNLIEDEATTTLRPFEALLTIGGISSISSFSLGSDTDTRNIPASADDQVIETRYYTLQGVEIQQPIENGIYLVKKIYKSGKEEGVKMYNKK